MSRLIMLPALALAAALLFLPATVSRAETIIYTYDSMKRLIKVQYGNGTTIIYTYDKMGNRITKVITP